MSHQPAPEHLTRPPMPPVPQAGPAWPGTTTPFHPGLRVGDAERQHACVLLADHHAAGRLDFAEFTARQEAVLLATTGFDLARQLHDLPPLDGPVVLPQAWPVAPAPQPPAGASVGTMLARVLLGLGFGGFVLMSWGMCVDIGSRYGGLMFLMFLALCCLVALVGTVGPLRPGRDGSAPR